MKKKIKLGVSKIKKRTLLMYINMPKIKCSY